MPNFRFEGDVEEGGKTAFLHVTDAQGVNRKVALNRIVELTTPVRDALATRFKLTATAEPADADPSVAITSAELSQGGGALGKAKSVNANYTLDTDDAGKTIESNAAGAIIVTVPTNADEPFPIGAVVGLCRYGAGALTVAGASGVTVRAASGTLAIGTQYGEGRLRKRADNEWVLSLYHQTV